jgi:hypothetical protein
MNNFHSLFFSELLQHSFFRVSPYFAAEKATRSFGQDTIDPWKSFWRKLPVLPRSSTHLCAARCDQIDALASSGLFKGLCSIALF